MESTPKQQILRALKDAKNILLLAHQQIDGDGLGAMIALYLAFQKLGKQATAFSFDPVPGALDFLPEVKNYLKNEINSFNDFIITIDCSNTNVDRIKYNTQDNKVNIIVTPKDGNFSVSDIAMKQGKGQYDCVIVLDTGDIQQLGKIYKDNPKLFYDVPVINIDHHVTNTFFGTINLVDPKSTATCEIILGIIEALESQSKIKLLDATIATYLLTGITVDTGSFQNSNTTPKSFSVAAQLLALGADQQTIIKNLYKTHKLSKLKLWGHALSHIKEDKETNLVWTTLSRQDFSDTEASDDEVEGVIDELITSAPGADIVFLLRERNDGVVACSIRTLDSTDASKLAMLFNGGGHKRAAGFKIKGDTLEKIENFVVKKFRDYKKGALELPTESKKEHIGDDVAFEANIPAEEVTPPVSETAAAEAQSFISKVQEIKKEERSEEKSEIKDQPLLRSTTQDAKSKRSEIETQKEEGKKEEKPQEPSAKHQENSNSQAPNPETPTTSNLPDTNSQISDLRPQISEEPSLSFSYQETSKTPEANTVTTETIPVPAPIHPAPTIPTPVTPRPVEEKSESLERQKKIEEKPTNISGIPVEPQSSNIPLSNSQISDLRPQTFTSDPFAPSNAIGDTAAEFQPQPPMPSNPIPAPETSDPFQRPPLNRSEI